MKTRHLLAVYISAACLLRAAGAAEPNETSETSTLLPSGTLMVSDALTPPEAPETLIGVRDHSGEVYFVAPAPGLTGAPTNSGSVNFSVTGIEDQFFDGGHGQAGPYEVFVDVYDFFDDLVDTFSETRTLTPGEVHDFDYSDFNWLNGSYDVFIDNNVGAPGDIDFFTFTGLTPGANFTAETFDPEFSNVDTLLAWFDSSGALLADDDDDGEGALSKLQGAVPGDGMLTFAVTGFGDDSYAGEHNQVGSYELRLSFAADLPADFNGDNQVNAQDLTAWKQGFSATSAAADADDDGDSDGQDLLVWQQNLGKASPRTPQPRRRPSPARWS